MTRDEFMEVFRAFREKHKDSELIRMIDRAVEESTLESMRISQDTRETSRVDHPPHYNRHPSGVECIEIIQHMTFNTGSAVKYLWRAGLKDGSPLLEDLEKARWYIDKEIALVRGRK